MPTYRWTFTCEEMYDDQNESVNVTTKTLVSDSETFTDAMILLPQLFSGAGFYIEPQSFLYKDEPFEDWSYDRVETRKRVIDREFNPAGFRGGAVTRPVNFDDEAPYADPLGQVRTTCWGDPVCTESVDFLAGFPPTTSEE